MITKALPFLAVACLAVAACTTDPMPQAGIDPSPQYDGLYKGTGVLTHDMLTACSPRSDFFNTSLAVKHGELMWRTGYVYPYNYYLVKIPIAPNGTFQDSWAGRIMEGQITGNHMTAVSDSGACRARLSLMKVTSPG